MPRPLADLQIDAPDAESEQRDLRVSRRTARSFAAAVSVLLLAALVVNRSSAALIGDAANTSAVVSSGTIELVDDDEGHALFDLEDLTPARPVSRCVEVTYRGTILPVELSMRAEANGELADYLDVTIHEGAGGSYESCDGFTADRRVFHGTLDELRERGWIGLGEMFNSGASRSYRVEISVHDRQDALGLTTSLEFAWEVSPS